MKSENTQQNDASAARNRESGFSLVELLVVITIIGILATAVTVKVIGALGQAKVAKAQATVAKMKDAVGMYLIAEGRLPDSLDDLKQPIKGYEDGVLDGSLKDPWGQEYEYEQISSRKFVIRSYGADKQPGGEGEDADIDSDRLGEDEDSGE
ncbi:MAG: type II secretion system protein GspG [Planctomycetota bacterium]|jgi:general secretion pathway protein G